MKLGWSGFRSAFAFAIIAVTSAPEANNFGGGGGFWAVSCRAIAAVITRVRIVQRTRTRIRPPVGRRLYSILRQLRVLRAQVRTDIAFGRPHVVEPVRATLENLMKRATAEKVIQELVAVSGTLNKTVSASRSA